MKKIDLKDFKKIKKGSKILYMGGQVEVLDNNGYVLKLKGEDGRTFTINKSQFDHGGMIKEVSDGKKKKKKKEFHPDMMYEAKGKKVINDLYKMDAQIDYLSDADDATKKIWKKAGVNPNDDNQIILYSYVNSWPETKKLLDQNNVHLIKLISPMTDKARSQRLLKEAKGFVYYISATGITGSNKLDYLEINKNVSSLKKQTKTPVLVGFGIKSRKDVLAISNKTNADGIIIGSALIKLYFDSKMNFKKYSYYYDLLYKDKNYRFKLS